MSELRKPKSPGLVSSVNAAGLGAADTSRRFQEASAAFIHPARNPTRGSGRGAVGDISNFVAVAQAATTVPIASTTNRSEERRVGKEWRGRWAREQVKKNDDKRRRVRVS